MTPGWASIFCIAPSCTISITYGRHSTRRFLTRALFLKVSECAQMVVWSFKRFSFSLWLPHSTGTSSHNMPLHISVSNPPVWRDPGYFYGSGSRIFGLFGFRYHSTEIHGYKSWNLIRVSMNNRNNFCHFYCFCKNLCSWKIYLTFINVFTCQIVFLK